MGEHNESRTSGKSAEHIARIVFAFLSAANELANGMEMGEDTKLLRIGTLKNEIVIVPGQYTMVLFLSNARK